MDLPQQHQRIESFWISACLSIGLVLRLAVTLAQSPQLTQDRDAYLGIATSLVEGRGFSSPNSTVPTAFRPPLYPLSLAAGMDLLGIPIVVGGINILTGVLTIWLTAIVGNGLHLGPRRFIAALLVGIDPLLVSYSCQPMTESLCTFLAVLWLWRELAAHRESPCAHVLGTEEIPSPQPLSPPGWGEGLSEHKSAWSFGNIGGQTWNRFLSGFAFGLLVLCRPTFWLIAGIGGLYWLFCDVRSKTQSPPSRPYIECLKWVWSAAGILVVVAPWLIRNWLVFGVPILTTTHGGYTLLLGNNPVFYQEVVQQPWGTVWQHDSLLRWQSDLETEIERDLGADATEVERDQWHANQAKRFMAADPRSFFLAVIHRIRSLWNVRPQGEAATQTWVAQVVGLFYTIVLTAGCLGLIYVSCGEGRTRWLPLYVLIASVQLAHLFYWTNARMRAPLTPAIALFAVAVIPGKQKANSVT